MPGATSAPGAIPTMYFLLYPPFKGRKSHVSTADRKISTPFAIPFILLQIHATVTWQVADGEVDSDPQGNGLNKNLDTRFFDGSTYLV
jgi:hypothetical protein